MIIFVSNVLPFDGLQSVCLQVFVGAAELVVAEPAAAVGGQGGGMYAFQHQVLVGVDEGPFALRIRTPQQENQMFLFLGDGPDDCIGEGLPAFVLVRACLMRPDGERGV